MKVLFQGDSITDAGRDRDNLHDLGEGYPFYVAKMLIEKYPNETFEFINLGISGNRTCNLVERLQADFIDINPDIVSIMIGVNDTWHYGETKDWLSNEKFENNYRTLLQGFKEKTNAKILIIEQFLLPTDDKEHLRTDLNSKIVITRKLAREYADAYIPLDGLFAKALLVHPSSYWSEDGVHPNEKGSKFIAEKYIEAFSEIIGD